MTLANNDSQIVLFESSDGVVALDVELDVRKNEVWLSQDQMAVLFNTTKQNVSSHISNCFKEGELERDSVVKKSFTTASDGKSYKVNHYNLDMIISVGYRVKSQRGVEFRRWATDVLRRYIIDGRAENDRRLQQLSQTVTLLERVSDDLDTDQVLEVVKSYASALDLLDDYDHQRIARPAGSDTAYVLGYEECLQLIGKLRFSDESDLFGVEKTIRSRAALRPFTNPLVVRSYIRRSRRRPLICCIS